MANKDEFPDNRFSDFLMYKSESGSVKIEILFGDETVWLTQPKIAQLFGVDRSVVTKHLKNIFDEGELKKEATSAKFAQVQIEGEREVSRNIEFYNLDAILSVGYRVNSKQATQFRIWANGIVEETIDVLDVKA